MRLTELDDDMANGAISIHPFMQPNADLSAVRGLVVDLDRDSLRSMSGANHINIAADILHRTSTFDRDCHVTTNLIDRIVRSGPIKK